MFLLRVIVTLFHIIFFLLLLLLLAVANISTSNKLWYDKLSTAYHPVKINIIEKGLFQKECKELTFKERKDETAIAD